MANNPFQQSFHRPFAAYLCDECGKSFKLPRSLSQHKLKHSEPMYGCTSCVRKFHTSSELNRHASRHTREKFVCGLCNAQMISYRGLKTHMGKWWRP